MILLIALIFSLALILPASAADINDDAISANEITADEVISEGEAVDVELTAKDTVGIYGNSDTTLKVYAHDSNGKNVTDGTVIFMDVFGKDYTANVVNGTAKSNVFVGETGEFNITCQYIGTARYNNASTILLLSVPVANTTCNNIVATRYDDTVYFTGNMKSDYTQYPDYDDYEEVTEGFLTVYVDGEKLGTCDVDVNGNYVYMWKTTRDLIGKTINFTAEFTNSKNHFNPSRFSKLFSFEASKDTKIITNVAQLEDGSKMISGIVLDEDGNNVIGGTITVNDNHTIIVDTNGTFRFYAVNETPKAATYEIGYFDWGSKADIRQNVPLMNALDHTELTDKLVDLCNNGTPYIKFGNGNGKTVVVNVGTHGGELPSQVAGFKLINLLADYGGEINGTIYVIPTIFPEATANNTRIYNGINLNTVADVNGTLSNNIVKFAISVGAAGLGDFHNTRHSDSDVGITCAMCSHYPTEESYYIAKFIADETGYYLYEYARAGDPYAGAIEDYANILGTPSVTCESLSNHRAVEYGTPEMSYSEMRAFLRYFGFDLDEMPKIQLDYSQNIILTFESPYNYNMSLKSIAPEGTFSALQELIYNAEESVIVLENDYAYNNETDNVQITGIMITKDNLTIDGNGHTIDGLNQARIFSNIANNVTISNLNIINGYRDIKNGGAILSLFSMTLNNITFENNNAPQGGAVYTYGNLTVINSTFTNSSAQWGGAIYSKFSAEIYNSVFAECEAKYGGAIYAENELTVENSAFRDLHANQTAGAIGFKDLSSIEITNTTFLNATAAKEGGAIYIDGNLDEDETGTVNIVDSRFYNSSAEYGGALVQLTGELDVEGCEFAGNTALFDGGAIYVSFTQTLINDTLFDENKIADEGYSHGGAIYIDNSNTNILNSSFTANAINAVYGYDSVLYIANSSFSDNGEAIHAVFSDCTLIKVDTGNDTLFLNGTEYGRVIKEVGKSIILINNAINVAALPSRYDSRDWGWVSSVKDQGNMGSCWTFGTCGALESALLKATGIEYDFSENNMQDSMLQYSKYGILDALEGGSREMGYEYALSWFGVLPTEYDSYDELGKLSPLIISEDKIHVFDVIFAKSRANSTDNDALKRAILKCGSVTTGFTWNASCYNDKTFAHYQTLKNNTNHAISIVGWDDNYPASNFATTAPGNGAFIVKNSWGEDWGEKGFFYLSYYDTSLLNTTYAVGFIIENTEKYTANYQTDIGGDVINLENNSSVSYKNSYEAVDAELISAVGTYFNENENYALEIYVNDKLVHSQNGTAPFNGYHTVKLTEEIPVKAGDVFTAVINKTSVRLFIDSRQYYLENMTFLNLGNGWEDLALENETISLKVYTKDLAIYTQDLVKLYKNASRFEAYVGDAGVNVTFELNGVNYTRVSDENGTASIAINLNPGEYSIKTIYGNYSVENSITVLPTLIADNLVKYFRNASQFYITLIDGEGNPVAGKNITMNINGVFYNRVTNENGTARLNINLNPGEYILTALDPLTGLQMSYNITVLSTLEASDLDMKYKDGSTFNVSVVDGEGKALSGVNVTFNINGVFYNRTTDSEGIARLNINLMAGEYIITSEYDDLRISNTITIRD